jgi:hypothetical protein
MGTHHSVALAAGKGHGGSAQDAVRGSTSLTQRLQFIEEAKWQFWKKWMQQVFSGRMLNHKWTKSVRNVAVGDIVYLNLPTGLPGRGWVRVACAP